MKSMVGLIVVLGACTDGNGGSDVPKQHLPKPQNPTLTLLVSNQSFDLPTVDIEIRIDGKLAVTGEFKVEGQHTWIPFDFNIGPGEHQMTIVSAAGETMLDKPFTMDDRKWAVVSFWYYQTGSPEPTPQQFSLSVLDEQPYFD